LHVVPLEISALATAFILGEGDAKLGPWAAGIALEREHFRGAGRA
jgi:hypothetical protein